MEKLHRSPMFHSTLTELSQIKYCKGEQTENYEGGGTCSTYENDEKYLRNFSRVNCKKKTILKIRAYILQ
jgi:hypothetical protein